jgi:Ca-activated chloride channel family protein
MRRGKSTNFLDLFIILTLVLGVRAVSAGELGSLQGQVLQRGTAVALQASVSIRCGTTQRAATADGSGAFSFTGLPIGSCTVTASLAGFSSATHTVKVTATGVSVKLVLAAANPVAVKDVKKKPAAELVAADKAEEKAMRSPSVVAPSPMKVKRANLVGSGSAASAGVIGRSGRMPGPSGGPMAQQEQDPNFNTEGYSRIDDNPFRFTEADPLSTFSSDVDTASYSNLRRFLSQGNLPPKDAVRIEEMINYFSYDYPAPKGNDPFSVTTEVSSSPWTPKHQLVRIGLQAPAIDDRQVPARNLVFLLDVSGSMSAPNKLPLLKQAMNLLVDTLRPEDKVSIAVYAGAEGMALAPTSGRDKDKIRQAIFALESGGSTNGAAGIQLAYNMAEANKIKNGINRVILCTDGDFNVGTTSEGDLTRLIEKERERGIFLTVLGFGMGNLKDSTMEKLADRGNGNYGYIDSLFEARKILVKEAGATLVTVAKDVKLQVEFNPALVAGYRLIGYENRLLRNEDFNDDKKDAGDIGAGHSVTALYEIVPVGVAVPAGKVDELKYQEKATPAAGANHGELLTVKVRYKEPNGHSSKLLSQPVRAAESKLASSDFQWAMAMAGFGMLLRESPHRGSLTWNQVAAIAASSIGKDPEGYRKQAFEMINAASKRKRVAGN